LFAEHQESFTIWLYQRASITCHLLFNLSTTSHLNTMVHWFRIWRKKEGPRGTSRRWCSLHQPHMEHLLRVYQAPKRNDKSTTISSSAVASLLRCQAAGTSRVESVLHWDRRLHGLSLTVALISSICCTTVILSPALDDSRSLIMFALPWFFSVPPLRHYDCKTFLAHLSWLSVR